MEHITSNDFKINKPTAVVLGNFDGVHLGHKSLIDKALFEKEALTPTVLSFYPHPAHVLISDSNTKLITTRNEKAYLLNKLGIDIFIEYPFDTKFAAMDAEEFVEDILFTQVNCKTVIVGENYRFGKNRTGDTVLLRRIASKYNARVIVAPIMSTDSSAISSTLIRQYISGGHDIKEANRLLTYPYMTIGNVVNSDITLDFRPSPLKLLPKDGVYLTRVCAKRLYESITTICTLDGEAKIIKTYLPNFEDKPAVGEEIVIYYFDCIGDEKISMPEQYEKYCAKNIYDRE